MRSFRLQKIRQAGGWRRLFIAGSALLFIASLALGWHVRQEDMEAAQTVELVLAVWSIGALALAILTASLSLLDAAFIWVGKGFGLTPATTRIGLCAVLAGLTFAVTAAAWLRYETVMPEGGSLRTGDLCVVLDRWTGEAKPCTEEAVTRRHRKRSEPLRTQEQRDVEVLWRQVVGIVAELLEVGSWLPGVTARGCATRSSCVRCWCSL